MIEKNKETNKYHAVCDCCYEYGSFKQGVKEMSVTLEEKINRLRAAEKRLRKHLSEDEFGVVRRTADGFKQEADWMEELKRYRDLEEQGRLLVLPCKAGEHPEETRLTRLLKNYPNTPLNDDGIPIYICTTDLGLMDIDDCDDDCVICWNRPIEEE